MDDIVTSDVGGRLRQARERRGLSLHDAARQTKLSINVLQAVERNDFASLPRGVYRRAYIRTLAAEFGLNANELAADYCASYEPPIESPPVESSRDCALADRWLQQLNSPRRSIVTLVILIALAIGWFAWPDGGESPLASATLAEEPIPSRPLLDTVAASHLRRASASAEGIMTPSRLDVPLRIALAANDWCWVAAESDGKRALYRLVAPGEHVVLEGQRMISLRLGNGGSVTLSINDGPRRLAGNDSEVIDMKLTPENVDALRDAAVETVSGD
jgi:transcriptional regulator with XRE-family HTH domain